jgi:hypothetical protein
MSEAKSLDDMSLYVRGLLVHGIRAECSADYGACGAAPLGQHNEVSNRLGDVVRVPAGSTCERLSAVWFAHLPSRW